MILRKASIKDKDDVWSWYSDPLSRKMSIHDDCVDYKSHISWFQNSLEDSDKTMYIGYEDEYKIGLSRFDFNKKNKCAYVSITLDKNFRGKNLSKKFLQLSIDKFLENSKTTLKAKIKYDNLPSISCFKSCNFQLSETNDKFYTFIKNT